MLTATAATLSDTSSGGRLVAADGRALPLTGAGLAATARGGLARAVLTQRFKNAFAEPLQVSYLFPLPHDGAVSGFAFTLDGRRTVGEVDRKAAARERFERALVDGRTAAIVEELRGSLFTQEVGNVPPGAEVEVELTVDQRLTWLPEGSWEWRFPTSVAPRYQGEPGRSPEERRSQVDVADGPLPVRLTLALQVRDALAAGGTLASPSHPIHVAAADGAFRAGLSAEGGVQLDRDLVIRWPVAAPEVGVSLDVARAAEGSRLGGRTFGLLTVVPPAGGPVAALPRDLVVLLDTSGSMSGAPLDQARAVVSALVRSLGDRDRLELIEFSNAPRSWRTGAVQATEPAKQEALAWLAGLEAGGSTEMTTALLEALKPLGGEAQRQVVLVTDGEIGFEREVVRALKDHLPSGSRLHTVGVGSAVNRSLTSPTARAGRGVEVLIGLGEPPEDAARRLLARTVAPAVTDLEVAGTAVLGQAPARLPDLFAGAPALAALELAPGGGTLTLRGRTAGGAFERTVTWGANDPTAPSTSIPALFARELVEDLELRSAAGEEVDAEIERAGLEFQIATRLTTWVAVSEERTVDPTEPTRRVRMPQQLPYGMSVEGLGIRRGSRLATHASMSVAFKMRQVDDVMSTYGEHAVEASADADMAPYAPDESLAKARMERRRAKKEKKRLAATAAQPPAPLTQAPRALERRRLEARITLSKPDLIWVVAEVTHEALPWAPGTTVTAVLDDGTELELSVERSATTAAGRLAVWVQVRLGLRLTSPLPAGRAIARVLMAGLEFNLTGGAP